MKSRSRVSLNALRTFEAFARHLSMTRAADELSVTPGAVSRQLSELQSKLGFELYVGPRTCPVLTPSGQELAASVTRALDDIERTLVLIDAERDTALDVACLSTLAARWLIPRLLGYKELHPDIDLRLTTDPPATNTTEHNVDVSITVHEPGQQAEQRDTELFEEQLGLVMAPSIAASHKISSPKDIREIPLLESKTRPNAWASWIECISCSPIDVVQTSTFEHVSLAIEAAAAGLGMCVTPKHLVLDDLKSDRLSAPLGFHRSGYVYIARTHGGSKPKVTGFINWLSNETSEL